MELYQQILYIRDPTVNALPQNRTSEKVYTDMIDSYQPYGRTNGRQRATPSLRMHRIMPM